MAIAYWAFKQDILTNQTVGIMVTSHVIYYPNLVLKFFFYIFFGFCFTHFAFTLSKGDDIPDTPQLQQKQKIVVE